MESLLRIRPMKLGALLAAAEAVYIGLVVSLLTNIESFFSSTGPEIVGAMLMLMLFVFSVALSGIIMFGAPALLALKGKVRESVIVVGWTVGWFFLLFLLLALGVVFLG